MKLAATLTLHAGGEGSGCNPEAGRCGRIPVHEVIERHEKVKSLREDARMNKSNVRYYKRRGDHENARRVGKEADALREQAKQLAKETKEFSKTAQHENFGRWKANETTHSPMVGRFKTFEAPNGDKLEIHYVTGWAKQGVGGGFGLKLTLTNGRKYEMLTDDLHGFLKHHFGIETSF